MYGRMIGVYAVPFNYSLFQFSFDSKGEPSVIYVYIYEMYRYISECNQVCLSGCRDAHRYRHFNHKFFLTESRRHSHTFSSNLSFYPYLYKSYPGTTILNKPFRKPLSFLSKMLQYWHECNAVACGFNSHGIVSQIGKIQESYSSCTNGHSSFGYLTCAVSLS